jgi:hypothetical protein
MPWKKAGEKENRPDDAWKKNGEHNVTFIAPNVF